MYSRCRAQSANDRIVNAFITSIELEVALLKILFARQRINFSSFFFAVDKLGRIYFPKSHLSLLRLDDHVKCGTGVSADPPALIISTRTCRDRGPGTSRLRTSSGLLPRRRPAQLLPRLRQHRTPTEPIRIFRTS